MESTKIAVFKGRQIRKTIHDNEWWFSIIDIIEALTGNERPRKYWNDLKKKLINEGYPEVSEKIGQLKIPASDGKNYLTEVVNTENAFRIIQSIPSPKAEPFKRWLAKVGYERIQEIEDPELTKGWGQIVPPLELTAPDDRRWWSQIATSNKGLEGKCHQPLWN